MKMETRTRLRRGCSDFSRYRGDVGLGRPTGARAETTLPVALSGGETPSAHARRVASWARVGAAAARRSESGALGGEAERGGGGGAGPCPRSDTCCVRSDSPAWAPQRGTAVCGIGIELGCRVQGRGVGSLHKSSS